MSEKSRKPGVDFSIEEKGQLPLNSNDIVEDHNRNVATYSIPRLTLERSLSINYRTLSIQTSDSIQARKYRIKKEKKTATMMISHNLIITPFRSI